MSHYDCIIIGSGIAALAVASQLCEKLNVLVLTKGAIRTSNSSLAQGGVAAAIRKDDHWTYHYEDTRYAGCFHNSHDAVELLVQKAQHEMEMLIEQGMNFDTNEQGELQYGMEGAHQKPRIIHAGGDATGKELINFYIQKVNEKVTMIEHVMVTDIAIDTNRAIGVWAKHRDDHDAVLYKGAHIVLATGGCGALFEVTSNSSIMTGDGLAMAYRAGARLIDLEFTQFHPTMLYVNGVCKGLVSEAVRGEGATLVDENGRPIMEGVHLLKDLAPRDIVARTMQFERLKGHHVYLNISSIQSFKSRFPTITNLCLREGIDLESGLIPVAPGMHFLMGGVETDLFGRTTVDRLYAVGEVACTGVHGANRLASNSLLEGIVFGRQLASIIENGTLDRKNSTLIQSGATRFALPSKKEIQSIMTTYVGIERTETGLKHALSFFEQFVSEPTFFTNNVNVFTKKEVEIVNMLTIGWLMTKSALKRTESRGGHFRCDYPTENEVWRQQRISFSRREQIGVR
ncbi:L-aspartate oxidase [Bacillus sp. FJAT-47783]|uniref:L-aspartate oxidase n=1 Tax=Bacillus sp. FJAT-47783 TaxID=2922712 RepID=UPI001FAC612F|nr:L-aspartate oxidase [Bacillus sp. FJAT-47783]